MLECSNLVATPAKQGLVQLSRPLTLVRHIFASLSLAAQVLIGNGERMGCGEWVDEVDVLGGELHAGGGNAGNPPIREVPGAPEGYAD